MSVGEVDTDSARHIRARIELGGETRYLCGTVSHMNDEVGRLSLPPLFLHDLPPIGTCSVCLAVLRAREKTLDAP